MTTDRDPIFASLDMLIASGHGDDVRYIDPLQVSVRRDRNRIHGPKPLSVVEAIRLSGVSVCPQTVRDRLRQGFTMHAALHTPLIRPGRRTKK